MEGGSVNSRNKVQGNRLGDGDRDWFSTAKPADEQISLRELDERVTEGTE